MRKWVRKHLGPLWWGGWIIKPEEDARDAYKPCRGTNGNVCVAEGCYGEACLTYNPRVPLDDDDRWPLSMCG